MAEKITCKCYHAERNFLGKIGVCWGTKECEACSCGGDESKCDFYEYVRERVKKPTTGYEELANKLRRCGKGLCTEDCPDWTKENLYHTCQDELVLEAADAIEELSMKLHGDEAAIAGMTREIVRMVIAEKRRWIPVTERLPETWKPVLVYQPYKNDGDNPLIRMSWYTGAGIWRDCGQGNILELPATHWQPLPEPPRSMNDN